MARFAGSFPTGRTESACHDATVVFCRRFLARDRRMTDQIQPEFAANAMLCAVNQAAYLPRRQLQSQGQAFLEKGGFTESLYAARTEARTTQGPASPSCPTCGQPMVQRSAKAGPRSGQPFWGCSCYPGCKGTRRMEPAARSDRSD